MSFRYCQCGRICRQTQHLSIFCISTISYSSLLLQQALDDAEAALEAEESKVLRAQVEISQIRSEIEKRISEKEEEFENTRKNHQRTLESMQVGFLYKIFIYNTCVDLVL